MEQTALLGDTIKLRQLCCDENNDPTQSITGTPVCKVFGFDESEIATPSVDQVGSEAGLYEAELTVDAANGFSAGLSYYIKWTWVIGGTTHGSGYFLWVC